MAEFEEFAKPESIVVKTHWNIAYAHHAGDVASRFFRGLRDRKTIYGIRCPRCRRVLVPARAYCEQCFVAALEWVEVGPQGHIESFAINCVQYEGLPKAPYIIALIKLDAADTSILHWLGEVDLQDVEQAATRIHIGSRVEPVWKDQREGAMTDILYFRMV